MKTILRRILLPLLLVLLAAALTVGISAQELDLGIPVEERKYTLAELLDADEVLITSASALCIRVIEVDGKAVGGKAAYTVQQLQDALWKDFMDKTE